MATSNLLRRSLPAPPRIAGALRTHKTLAGALRTQKTLAHQSSPPHDFTKPSSFIGSWQSPPPSSDPREAQTRLQRLRRDYFKQVTQRRREYSYEMDLQRAEQERKADAKREAMRLANEQRKAAKAAAAETRAAERKELDENFRQMLMTERAQKLEYWREREAKMEAKRKEKKDTLRQQSSLWIGEEHLEKRILEAIVDTTPL